MKKYSILFFIISFCYNVVAQDDIVVENISTQKIDGKLLISYVLTGSNENQSIKITVSFRDKNNILDTLRHVSGDVGEVNGGKMQYLIFWDYLSEKNLNINELKRIEVDAELISTEPIISAGMKNKLLNNNGLRNDSINKNKEKKYFFVAIEAIGIKCGYTGNWGFALNSGLDLFYHEFSFLGSISKRIINNDKFQLHIYPLVGIHNAFHSDFVDSVPSSSANYDPHYSEYYKIGLAYGLGTSLTLGNHLYLNFDYYIDTQKYKHIMTGVGWRFK
jgi:hypothetical protein